MQDSNFLHCIIRTTSSSKSASFPSSPPLLGMNLRLSLLCQGGSGRPRGFPSPLPPPPSLLLRQPPPPPPRKEMTSSPPPLPEEEASRPDLMRTRRDPSQATHIAQIVFIFPFKKKKKVRQEGLCILFRSFGSPKKKKKKRTKKTRVVRVCKVDRPSPPPSPNDHRYSFILSPKMTGEGKKNSPFFKAVMEFLRFFFFVFHFSKCQFSFFLNWEDQPLGFLPLLEWCLGAPWYELPDGFFLGGGGQEGDERGRKKTNSSQLWSFMLNLCQFPGLLCR